MANSMNKEQAKQALKSGYGKSKALLNDKDKLDKFFAWAREKDWRNSNDWKGVVYYSSHDLFSKNFTEGKYTSVPYGTILAVTSALIYFASPIDFIPDFIPGIGYVDDSGSCHILFVHGKKSIVVI